MKRSLTGIAFSIIWMTLFSCEKTKKPTSSSLNFNLEDNSSFSYRRDGFTFKNVSNDQEFINFFEDFNKCESLENYLDFYTKNTKLKITKEIQENSDLKKRYLEVYSNYKGMKPKIKILDDFGKIYIVTERATGVIPKYRFFLMEENPIKFSFYKQEDGDSLPALVSLMNSLDKIPDILNE